MDLSKYISAQLLAFSQYYIGDTDTMSYIYIQILGCGKDTRSFNRIQSQEFQLDKQFLLKQRAQDYRQK